MRDRRRNHLSGRRVGRMPLVARLITLACIALVPACGAAGSPHTPSSADSLRPVPPIHVTPAQMALLPAATTFGTSRGAPQDQDPFTKETGIVLHPSVRQVVYTRPGGPAIAVLPTTELHSPTWLPVVMSQPGWDEVLLPTRPNRSTGWIYLDDGGVQTAYSSYSVEINLATYRLSVFEAGRSLGSWTVSEGASGTPTPTGRTFLLASMAPVHPTFSALILPLGAHSDTMNTFDGGPGTVGLHGWPDPSVFGHANTHGCVRVPPAALRVLSRVPLGSQVMIIS